MPLTVDQYWPSEIPHARSVGAGTIIWQRSSDVSGGLQVSDGDEWIELSIGQNRWLSLLDFAGDHPINTGVYSAVDAMRRAIVVAQATGQPIYVPPGTYLMDEAVTLPSHIWINGAGETAVFKHGDRSLQGVFYALDQTTRGVRLSNFKIDGNYSNNNGDTDGFDYAEIALGGIDTLLEDILITNFNNWAFLLWGERIRVYRCRAEGVAPNSYATEFTGTYLGTLTGLTPHYNLASIHGFFTNPQADCNGLYMEDCSAVGTRASGIYVAGTNATLVRPIIGNCHRGYHPDVNSAGTGSSGGPQLGFPVTSTPGTDDLAVVPTRMTVIAPIIEGTTGPVANAIEIGAAFGMEILEPQIEYASNAGISIFKGSASLPTSNVRIIGGVIKSCAVYGISILDSLDVTLDGIDFVSNTGVALSTTGASDRLTYVNLGFNGNTTNWAMSATPTIFQSFGHRVANGAAIPIRHEGTPSTTGTGGLGALPIARAVTPGQASGTLAVTTTPTNITGASASLAPGKWLVIGVFCAVVADAADIGTNLIGSLVTSGGTATITNSTAQALFKAQAQPVNTMIMQTWLVSVTATTTAQLQGSKAAGAATASGFGLTHTTITPAYQGNP